MMAGVLASGTDRRHLGPRPRFTLRNVLVSGGVRLSVGFAVAHDGALARSGGFSGRKAMLTVIDPGHWHACVHGHGLDSSASIRPANGPARRMSQPYARSSSFLTNVARRKCVSLHEGLVA